MRSHACVPGEGLSTCQPWLQPVSVHGRTARVGAAAEPAWDDLAWLPVAPPAPADAGLGLLGPERPDQATRSEHKLLCRPLFFSHFSIEGPL